MIFDNISFDNNSFDESYFKKEDLYVFALGYESRSKYLYCKLSEKHNSENRIVFLFDDINENIAEDILDKIKYDKVSYSNYKYVQDKIIENINININKSKSITVHIDYSSMPRSWYCKLPVLLKEILRKDDKVYFWYSSGDYLHNIEKYPSAGIESFSFFSGKPSLKIDSNRVHIVALGYDVVRTEAIISIIDPSFLVTCYAYDSERDEFQAKIEKDNKHLMSRSAMSLSLHINDFSFMISKLREIVNELLPLGDIILIPDGPKPLIFAISLIPDLLNKHNVTCLHVVRNSNCFKPIDVSPNGFLYGFSMRVDRED